MRLKWGEPDPDGTLYSDLRRVGNAEIDAWLEHTPTGWQANIEIDFDWRNGSLTLGWDLHTRTHDLAAAQARVEQEADTLLARVRELARRGK